MSEKSTKTKATVSFDDRNMPPNDLTVERIEQIEKAAMPIFDRLLEELRNKKPELFKLSRKS